MLVADTTLPNTYKLDLTFYQFLGVQFAASPKMIDPFAPER
jgi:hypothetical protein